MDSNNNMVNRDHLDRIIDQYFRNRDSLLYIMNYHDDQFINYTALKLLLSVNLKREIRGSVNYDDHTVNGHWSIRV